MSAEENSQNTNRILAILYVIPIPFLAIAIAGISSTYDFYVVLRYVVFIVCLAVLLIGWVPKDMRSKEPAGIIVANVLIAVTFNPFDPLYLFRGAWVVIDLVAFIYFIFRFYIKRKDAYPENNLKGYLPAGVFVILCIILILFALNNV
jgi:hypothetical protein